MTRSYIIRYLKDEGSTRAYEGYFWNRENCFGLTE